MPLPKIDKEVLKQLSVKFIYLVERPVASSPDKLIDMVPNRFYNAKKTFVILNYRRTSKL